MQRPSPPTIKNMASMSTRISAPHTFVLSGQSTSAAANAADDSRHSAGTRGRMLTKTMAPRIDDSVAEAPVPSVTTDVTDFYRNVMDAIEGKAEPIVKNPQVMRVMKLLEACFESHRLGQAVPFERG